MIDEINIKTISIKIKIKSNSMLKILKITKSKKNLKSRRILLKTKTIKKITLKIIINQKI